MAQRSAGLLIYCRRDEALSVLLVHPGGPYWRSRDVGAWQIPKGGIEAGEDPLGAALREAREELGMDFTGTCTSLGELRQTGGKLVIAYAIEADVDVAAVTSNSFDLEWPPRSGQMQRFPEVDQARWFDVAEARTMMLESQRPFLDRLEAALAAGG